MGLLGGDSPNTEAEKLANNAQGDSVTAKRLTTTETGMMNKDLLQSDPIIAYLKPEEQPHHYFHNDTKGITRNGTTVGGGNDSTYRSQCVITDKQIYLFTEGKKGNILNPSKITDIETNTGRMKHRLTIITNDNEYTLYLSNSVDEDELDNCEEYLQEISSPETQNPDENELTEIDGLSSIWNNKTNTGPIAEEALSAEPQGDYVTKDEYRKVESVLDPDEKVHFITQGSTVDVEGSSAGQSLFGDDRSRKSGTKGWVRAIITNKRVAVKIPQVLGDDERSVPYSSITSVDLDTGLVNKRLTLQTAGQTYHIEAHEPDKDEVRQAVKFIRDKVSEANKPQVVTQSEDSEPDPLDQIEKLKQLNDQGVLSDEEFESKKQDLLDKV